MEVADRIAVLAGGVVEQVGSPHEIYENPANEFVMSFLGSVTRLGGQLVRPHDIVVSAAETPGATTARVDRVVRLGFEVRAEMSTVDGEVWTQLTREGADALAIKAGDTVYLTARSDAKVIVPAQAPAHV